MGPIKIKKIFNMYFVNLVVCLKQEWSTPKTKFYIWKILLEQKPKRLFVLKLFYWYWLFSRKYEFKSIEETHSLLFFKLQFK